MRVVLTCLPFYSHLVPVVLPVARALRRAGHEVAVATAPGMASEVTAAGIEHLALPNVLTLAQLLDRPDVATSPGMPGDPAGSARAATARAESGPLAAAFAGPLAGVFARDLIRACEFWTPDLIVRECNEFGGHLAAERLGVRQAVLDIAPGSTATLPSVRDALNGQRVELGLAEVDDPWYPNRTFVAGFVPPGWYPADPPRCYRLGEPDGVLDGSLDLPADRPLVVAGLGSVAATVVPESPELLELLITALGRLPVTAVVGLGSDARRWPGSRPDNVRLLEFAPQRLLLESAELFVSHGGFGGVAEAVRTGTPMVVLPLFSDQPYNAERVAALGLGVRLDPAGLDPEVLADACAKVLDDQAYRRNSAAMSRRALGCPGLETLAEDLFAHHR
ncbi:glycosyltransferase [Amycolatopsis sp. YIM 10]|uniref:glycosyltransferase n=1 Tax=Amycolatopsis sp. YIM 10 TaxID=2653857 RepID=UPI0012902E0B|nr:glycosyltransferase [Amycolatopsis sp. YIM 10]QFU88216.1 L-noviosyl transferase [Amycolatopsis sp. YIM 10]